ncbi:MAG: GatB/YqeY domain-containing protein [bacterium]
MAELKTAMKAKDSIKVNTIRLLRAQLKDLQIAKGEALTPDDEISVLTNAVKKRKEAIKFYEQSHREELKSKEMRELEIISAYLPKQLTENEIQEIVEKVIQEVGATTIKDLGKVMSTTMKQLKGQADGKLVQEIVRNKLS